MITLKCKCGTKFRVKPGLAGKVVATPCCQSRISVPVGSDARQPPKPDRVRMKCSCGQVIAFARPNKPIVIQCSACQKRLRYGTPSPRQVAAAIPARDNHPMGSSIGLPPANTPQFGRSKKASKPLPSSLGSGCVGELTGSIRPSITGFRRSF